MKLLAIDCGNSYTKLGCFSDSNLIDTAAVPDSDLATTLNHFIEKYSLHDVIVSSVRNPSFDIKAFVQSEVNIFRLSTESKFPFQTNYQSKQTIGLDRLANAAGAWARFKKDNILIVDCGTCTTYTLLENGVLKGGAIAPGVNMRFEALNFYTGKLPLLSPVADLAELPGMSTEGSMRAGVELASILETDALIAEFGNKSASLIVLLTGGGSSFFEQHLKSPTFAAPYLTLEGLHEIFVLNK